MKMTTQQHLSEVAADAYREGIEYTVREILTRRLVLQNTTPITGAKMQIFADVDKPEEIRALVDELLAHSPNAIDTTIGSVMGYMSLTRKV